MPPANQLPAPLDVHFAPGSAVLSPSDQTALVPFCKAGGRITINARAPADPADPSAAMRLSLARAFAVRDALSACGVAASAIVPRAQGAVPGQDDNITQIVAGETDK